MKTMTTEQMERLNNITKGDLGKEERFDEIVDRLFELMKEGFGIRKTRLSEGEANDIYEAALDLFSALERD